MSDEGGHREELLRQYLEHTDDDCPACGYSLRGLQEAQCPECGEPLRLRIGVDSAVPRWFVAGLVGICASLGLHLPLSIVSLLFDADTFFMVLPGTTIAALSLIGWVSGRHRMGRAGALARSCLTSMATVLPILLLALLFILGVSGM